MGENPAVGSANGAAPARSRWRKLDWLVVRDLVEIETAAVLARRARRSRPASCAREDIGTEVFFLPAAAHTEKDGSFTNTQRLLQWHHKAVEPPGDCRSELWFMYHLGRRIREKLAGSDEPTRPARARPHLGLPDRRARTTSPTPRRCCAEINGCDVADGRAARRLPAAARTTARPRAAAGSTPAVYAGRRQPGRAAQAAAREQSWVAPEWGWAWPPNRRILYNRASADPDGRPWSERKRYVWWDAEAGQWTGEDVPDFVADKPPGLRAAGGRARPRRRCAATSRSSCRPTARAGCSPPAGSSTGRCPTHYEPQESPFDNPLYAASRPTRRASGTGGPRTRTTRPHGAPASERLPVRDHDLPADRAPHGGRHVALGCPYLAELQPEMFCEVSPELAARARARARRLGDDRDRARGDRGARAGHRADARRCASSGAHRPPGRPALPLGRARARDGRLGQRPARARARPERAHPGVKAATCDIRPGRRPRGPALRRSSTTTGARAGRADGAGTSWHRGRTATRRGRASASSPTRRSASAARRARSRARSGTTSRRTAWTSPASPTTTPAASARHLAPRRVRRAAQPLERERPLRRRSDSGASDGRAALADDLGRLQALHARRLPRGLPDRRAVPHRVRHRRRAGGRLQRLRLLRARVPVRRASTSARTTAAPGSARSATTASRTTGAGVRAGVPDRLDPVRRARRAARARRASASRSCRRRA